MSVHHIGIMASARPVAASGDDYATGAGIVMEFGTTVDEGPNALQMYVRGNPGKNSATPKDGLYAWVGDTNYDAFAGVLNSATSVLNPTNEDFCIELWFRAASEPTSTCGLIGIWGTSGNRRWKIEYNASQNYFNAQYTTGGASFFQTVYDFDINDLGASDVWDGDWHHLCFRRTGTEAYIHVDGNQSVNTTTMGTDSIFTGGTQNFYIGALPTSGSNPVAAWPGEIDEVRITIGESRYSGDFTPDSTPFGRNVTDDPDYANVALLVGFNSRFGITKAGTVTDDIVMVNYGASNGPFDQYGIRGLASFRYPYMPYNAEYNFGSGDFTVEAFGVYSIGSAWDNSRQILGCWHTATGVRSWRFVTTGGRFAFQYSVDSSTIVTVNFADGEDANTNYDLTAVRKGNTLYLYKNGTLSTTHDMTGVTLFDISGAALPLGVITGMSAAFNSQDQCVAATQRLRGFRINKGLGRFSGSSYTVPNPIPMT